MKSNKIRNAAYDPAKGRTAGAADLVSSFMLFAYVFGCLFCGILNDKKGPKVTCIAGIALFTGGVALSAFAKSLPLFMATYAIMAGLGSGFGNAACISCIQKWLPHRRGLASGPACAAYGLSTVIFTPISNWLMNQFRDGWLCRHCPIRSGEVTPWWYSAESRWQVLFS